MPKQEALLAWLNHYRQALEWIRHDEVPFTRAWHISNRTLQTRPKELLPPPKLEGQLELF